MLTAVRFIKSEKEGEESTVGVELYKKEVLEKRLLSAEKEYALKNPEADSVALKVLGTLIHYLVTDHKQLRGKGRGRGKDKGRGKGEDDEEVNQEDREEKGKLNEDQEASRRGNDLSLSASTSNINTATEINFEISRESNSNSNSDSSNNKYHIKKNENEESIVNLDDDTYDCSADCMYFKGDVLEALSDCTLVLKRFPILLAQFQILSFGDEMYSVDRYDLI